MLAREPFGIAGCDLIKLAAAGVILMVTLMMYVSISVCMQCVTGCSSSREAKREYNFFLHSSCLFGSSWKYNLKMWYAVFQTAGIWLVFSLFDFAFKHSSHSF